ncbi:MAG: hypothetical protein GX639_21765 [Fibrobacter sp.]|nr:hypothetical protein [Fibrobacter sp.]
MPVILNIVNKVKSILVVIVSFFAILNSEPVRYLHFYDAADNSLMFIEFEYDANGVNTSRSVYMSDTTFIKRIDVQTSPDGSKSRETSFNFNDDTLFSASYKSDADKNSFSIKDQFGVDQFGSDISYTETSTDNFDITQNNKVINKISYIKEGDNYKKIQVADNSGALLYYATVEYESGAGVVYNTKINKNIPSLRHLGNNRFEVRFTMLKPAHVSCELSTLSGRQVGKVVHREFTKGTTREVINFNKSLSAITTGVYLLSLSIDGNRVLKEKILIQRSKGGM